ncbi:MAG: WXG100 family type VII secretion target [Clostridia bacterium]|nr:WXG100 family type VII secretion target [Clostridia bacterium]
MGFEVNTEEVKRVAQAIQAIAGEVKQLSTGNVNRMRNSVEDNLSGEAADALKSALSSLSADINTISTGLDSIQKTLQDYVKRVEAADRAAEAIIRG